jgi:hypothetical protein
MTRYERNVNQVNSDFMAIKDKLIESGVDVPAGTPTADYAEKVGTLYDKGKQAEHDAFWDSFQGATRKRWSSSFQYECWNDTTFYPKYDLIISGDAASLFRYCGITDLEGRLNECGVILDTSECTSLNCGFGESKLLTTVPALDLRKCAASGSALGIFSGCISLKTIRKLIVSEETQPSSSFQNCPMLENITFEGVIGQNIDFTSCTKLTYKSIVSIIEHLSDTAEGKTLTLSKTAVHEAFKWYGGYMDENGEWISSEYGGTEEGSGNEWYPLVASKPNWQITLI